MTRLIDPGDGAAITLDELVDALERTPFDVDEENSFAALGPLLARLGRNRSFLADLAIAELKTRCAGQSASNGYGAQVFLLRPPNGRFVLRANFWPSADDGIVQASGTAPFVYGMAHDIISRSSPTAISVPDTGATIGSAIPIDRGNRCATPGGDGSSPDS